jgi:hypothetical protein
MHWLHYVFFGLMVALGGIAFVLYLRAKEPRAWIWLVVALVGCAGFAGLLAGRVDGAWRTLTMSAVFFLFAVDHLVQFVQSRRAGSPRKIHALLSVLWVVLGTGQAL